MVELNNEILREAEYAHYDFQSGVYFTDSKIIDNGLILWNTVIDDVFWNYATKVNISSDKFDDFIEIVKKFFISINRKPSVYVTPFTVTRNVEDELLKSGFKANYKDAWMFYEYDNVKLEIPKDFVIKKVESEKELEIFLEVFDKAYGNPDDVYNDMDNAGYIQCIKESFKRNKDFYFLGYFKNKPVSISVLSFNEKYAGIYTVGTIPKERGNGFGTILTLKCVDEAMKMGIKVIFLQTEQGSYNEKYYDNIGFKTKFIGTGYVFEGESNE